MSETSLYNGDCYELLPQLPDTSIDLVVTDPPYRISEEKGQGIYKKNVRCLDELKTLDSLEFSPKEFLDLVRPKMKRFYGYFFCNRFLIREYLE